MLCKIQKPLFLADSVYYTNFFCTVILIYLTGMSRIMLPSSVLGAFRGATGANIKKVGANVTSIASEDSNSGPISSEDWKAAADAWKLTHGEIFLPDLYDNLGAHCQQVAKTRPVAGLKSFSEKARKVVDYAGGLATMQGVKSLGSGAASALGSVTTEFGKMFRASPTTNAVLPGNANASDTCTECGRPHSQATPSREVRGLTTWGMKSVGTNRRGIITVSGAPGAATPAPAAAPTMLRRFGAAASAAAKGATKAFGMSKSRRNRSQRKTRRRQRK
jgi:hypothetical protein